MESLLPLALLAGAAWLLVFRPLRRQKAAQAAVMAAVAPGAEVVTAGGLRATVVSLDDDDVVLEIAEGVHVRFIRGAIRTVVQPAVVDSDPETETADEPSPSEPHDPPQPTT